MEIDDVIKGVERALNDKRAAKHWVQDFIAGMSPDDLKWAVSNGFNPWRATVQKFYLFNPIVQKVASPLLRKYWPDIEEELSDVNKIYQQLAQNEANREQLDLPETKQWLNKVVPHAYNSTYYYAFGVRAECYYCHYQFGYFPIEYVPNAPYPAICPKCGAGLSIILAG